MSPDQTTATLRGAAEALELRSAACHYDRHHNGEWVACALPACAGDRDLVVGLRQLATIRDKHPGADHA